MGTDNFSSLMRRWSGSRQDVSSIVIPAGTVDAIASEISTLSSNDLWRRVERVFETQPAMQRFVCDLCEPLSAAVAWKAQVAVASIFEMFEEHRGRRLPEIDRNLIQRCESVNEGLIEELSRGRRPSLADMPQPAVMQYVSSVLDEFGNDGNGPWTPRELYRLFLMLKTVVDATELAYQVAATQPARIATPFKD